MFQHQGMIFDFVDNVLKSSKDGRNWTNNPISTARIGRVLEMFSNGAEMMAKTDHGLFASRDNGRNWNKRA
ncbi:MAG: hypothetical protein LBB48_02730 [Treponema sp.]|jgi:hypothetical protein|nr:hypothetical protein [Treponema sp.]